MAALRAGVTFVNDNTSDVHFSLTNGSTIFNLWHGVGLKNVLYGSSVGTSADLRRRSSNPLVRVRSMRRLQRPDWVLSTSPEMSEKFFSRCFALPVERAPALGYPRLDPLIHPALRQAAMAFDDYSVLDRVGKKKVILYAPTLRQEANGFLGKALPHLSALSAALSRQDAVLFLKLHPKMVSDDRSVARLPANIMTMPEQLDLYPVLDRFDCLVTDYSSMFFDYIAYKSAGVVLYPFDLEEYKRQERDLAWDYDEATVGVRADTFDQLCSAVAEGSAFEPLNSDKLRTLRDRFWGGDLQLPTASERISRFVAQLAVPQ
jgi:CDP-glycerol glycerophosphotransferase (TagB/SpsB family)